MNTAVRSQRPYFLLYAATRAELEAETA